MRVIIVDDSRLARLELKEQLAQLPEAELVGEAENIAEALDVIAKQQPDVLLLDINLPDGDGFDLLEQLEVVPQVIFVTAFDEYAIRSFDYNALDYLLKPVRIERLERAFEKLRKAASDHAAMPDRLAKTGRFFIKDGERCYFVTLEEVIAFEAMGNYTRVHLAQATPAVYRSLSAIEARLPESFFRANRSWLVNTQYVQHIEPALSGGFELTLQDDSHAKQLTVEISKRQAVPFKQLWRL